MHTASASSPSGQIERTVPPTKPPPRVLRLDVRRQPGWPPCGQGAPPSPAVLSPSGHFVSDRTFAFVDLAGFTALTDAHGDEAAARLAERFCELARQSLRPQVLLVKSIGDAVMLASPDPLGCLLTVEDLLSACLREPDFPFARARGAHRRCCRARRRLVRLCRERRCPGVRPRRRAAVAPHRPSRCRRPSGQQDRARPRAGDSTRCRSASWPVLRRRRPHRPTHRHGRGLPDALRHSSRRRNPAPR